MTTLYNHKDVLTYFNDQNNVDYVNMIKYDKHKHKYHLLGDLIITDTNSVTIQLNECQVFDGHGHIITHNLDKDGLFISQSTQMTTVKNLVVLYKSLSNVLGGCGGIFAQNSVNFNVIHCKNLSLINQYCGGICGQNCSNF